MSNQRRIPPENLQGHHDIVVLKGVAGCGDGSGDGGGEPNRIIPKLPFRALKRTTEAHAQFWASEAGMHALPGDWTEIVTAFENYDMYLRLLADFRRERWKTGSTRQEILNPAGREAQGWLRLALVVFFRFGFDPRGRLQMGIGTTNLGRPGPSGPKGLRDDDVEDPDDEKNDEPALIRPRAKRG